MKTLLYTLALLITFGIADPVQAANRYWIASGTANWNSTVNWSTTSGGTSGASVPGSSDVAIFNNGGLGNCNLNATVTVSSLIINSTYTGTITQGANPVTVSGAVTLAGGTLLGSGGTMTFNAAFSQSGTGFTLPATLNMGGGAWTYTSGTMDVITNNSTVVFSGSTSFTGSLTLNNANFNNTTPWPSSTTLASGTTLTISGNMTMSGTAALNFTGSTINLPGNLNLTNTATGGGGSTVLAFTGTTNQSITSTLAINQSSLPSININKSSGTLILPALISMAGNNWTYTTGTIDATTNNSTVVFGGNTTITGSHTLNNINFNNTTPWPATTTLASGTTLSAAGTVTMSGTAALNFNNGTVSLLGNLNLTNTATGSGGSTSFVFAGTTNQSITSALTLNQSSLPSITINKSSGTLTLPALITMAGNNWTYVAGTIDATTNNSTVAFAGNTTITGSHTLNNITFSNTTPWPETTTLASGTTLTTSGTMNMSGTAALNFSGGAINLLGNLNLTNTATGSGGSTVLAFTGTTNQSIISALALNQSSLPSININKSSGTLTLPSLITMAGTNWTYTTGTIDATTNNSTIAFAGNTTITGSHTLNNITFSNTTPWPETNTLASGTVLTTSGTMTMSGTAALNFSGGTINLLGNLNLTNTATGSGGSTVLAFTGTTNQSIISALALNQSSLPSININKPSGTLTLPSLLTMGGTNWTYTTGAIDATTNNSTVAFVANTTITGNHTLNNITFSNTTPWPITTTVTTGTTLTTSGTMTMSGTAALNFSNGTIALLGDLNLTNTASGSGGSTILAFSGTGNQAIVSSLAINQSTLPSVNINKSSGTLTLPSLITMGGTNWTYTTGTIDATTNNSTVAFVANTTITGNHTLNNINFNNSTPWGTTTTVTTGTTLTAGGMMTMSGTASLTFSGGTINLLRDLNLTNTSTADGGTTVFNFNGTVNQAITSALSINQSALPQVTINKTSGTLTFPSLITMGGANWNYTAGTVDATTNASTVVFAGNTNIKSAGMNFYNMKVGSNTSTLTTPLSVDNDLTISSGVLSAGANTINLSGNWTNWGQAGFTEGTSTVNFNGAGVQLITAPGGENFSGVTVNNTGAGIQLANNALIVKTLTMTQGNIELAGNTLALGNSNANPGILARTSGTIIGGGSFSRWIKNGVMATGSMAGLFPVGTSANYRPFTVAAPTTGPTAGGTITLTYTDAGTNTAVSFPDGGSTVLVRKNLNWALTTGGGLAGGTYNLGISGTNYGDIGSVSDLRLTLVNSVTGTAGTNAGTPTNPQVNRTSVSLAGLTNTFYIASINAGMTPLPVTFLSFTATVEHADVVLNWSTGQEINNDYFIIQRSADGRGWEDLQQVAGTGTTNAATAYSAYDQSPLAGRSYYRLMIKDRDGAMSYSSVSSVSFNSKTAVLSIFPNPAVNYLTISFPAPARYEVTLLNEIGQTLSLNISGNGSDTVLNVSAMKPGIYFVRVNSGGMVDTRKVMIRR